MSRPQHLCIRPLNLPDIAQVLALEMNGFPRHERASPARIEYRLTVCPELCSGLFVREFNTEAVHSSELPDHSTIEKETLIGHIIGTKMLSETVTDASMEVPASFVPVMCTADGQLKEQYKSEELRQLEAQEAAAQPEADAGGAAATPAASHDRPGHFDSGKTIGIHSVIVHSDYRGKKLATLLIKDYLQKMNQQYVADSIALLCKDELVKFYAGAGFTDKGTSACHFGGESWHDMVLVLDHNEDEDDDED